MAQTVNNSPMISLEKSSVVWCIDKKPTDIINAILANPDIIEGLTAVVERDGNFTTATISRDHACLLVGRLVAVEFPEVQLDCTDCSKIPEITQDVAVFVQTSSKQVD